MTDEELMKEFNKLHERLDKFETVITREIYRCTEITMIKQQIENLGKKIKRSS